MGLSAQVTNEGLPLSFSIQSKKSITPVLMKGFDLNKIKNEDAKNDIDKSIPWRFGYEFNVNLGLENSGVWDELPNGDRIWRINIISKGAKSLNFIFDTYKIPRGATIYVYNNDKSDVLGAYTNIFNRPDQMLGTWIVQGENVWVEYFEPASVAGKGKLNIGKVIHGYRSIADKRISQKRLGDSGDCNQDVDCSVGDDFDGLKERLKHAVGFIIMNNSVCTGTLINNTSNDKAPYFLTANHCNSGNEATWAFRFNWISPDPSCGTELSSPDATINQTTSGARRVASNSESDFRLLSLQGGLDESWDLEWAGWDRTDVAPSYSVGIHHPNGDIMKVCRENQELSKIKTSITGIPDPVETWQVNNWDIGVTEGGSSGSALFDPKGRIVGQLSGGGAACSGTVDNNQSDFYGRFSISWDFGNTDATRLVDWLDPTNTSRSTLEVLSVEESGGNPPVPPEGEVVSLYFNTTEAKVNITNTARGDLKYFIYDIAGRVVDSGMISREKEQIDMSGVSSGMYFVYVENTSDGGSFTKKIIIDEF